MTAVSLLKLVEQSVFFALGIAATVHWLRRRAAGAAWLALTFGTLSVDVLVGRLVPDPTRAAEHITVIRVILVLLALFPYFLYRFGISFRSVHRRRQEQLARYATIAVIAATLAMPTFQVRGVTVPRWYGLYSGGFLLQWTLLSTAAVASLWRAGRDVPGLIQRRMRMLALGALVLNLSALLTALGRSQGSEAWRLLAQSINCLSAMLFLVGFAPPRALRNRWRHAENMLLRAAEAELVKAEHGASVAAIVLPQATHLIGGRGAAFIADDHRVAAAHQCDTEEISAIARELPLGLAPDREAVVTPAFVALPVRRGWLVLLTSASAPLVGADEIDILRSLSHLAGLALDRAELFARDAAARAALAEREAELAEAQRTAQLGSYSWDLRTGAVVWSDEMRRLLGYTPDEDLDYLTAFMDRIHPDDLTAVLEEWQRAQIGTQPRASQYRVLLPSGEVRWLHGRLHPVLDEATGAPARVIGTLQDVSDRKAAEDAIAFQALHDSLTGLPNRTLFLDRLRSVVARRVRWPSGLAVLFLDLDRFKWLNDSRGHAAGDELLVEVAQRLQTVLRPGDTIARFGGDEFVVLCEHVDTGEDALALAERLSSVLSVPVRAAGEETIVTASIGIAHVPADDVDVEPEALVRDADAAMYQAKERGRDRHELFQTSTRLAVIARHEMVNALRRGIDRGEFVVHYQPEIEITTGELVGFEALVRWDRGELGLAPPLEFVPLAEETGLIVPIGVQVLQQACQQVAAWQPAVRGATGRELTVSVNLAARQLMAPNLCDEVERALTVSGLPAHLLCLEITESVLLDDAEASAKALEQLKSLGVMIGVDDFGTGFSSLTYLKQFPVDVLKIDRSFVDGVGRDREDRAIVASVVDLAHAFGLTTISEGVETLEQLEELRVIGCEQGQGYLWSRPLPASEAGAWLEAHTAREAEADAAAAAALAAVEAANPRRHLTSLAGRARREPLRVLIVDDDRTYRQVVRMTLETEDGFAVIGEAEDGREAIALARHHLPDVVLLDLAMPGMGGLEALPLLLAVAPEAKVVVLSALDRSQLIDKADRQGATAFFTKSEDPISLLGLMEPLLASA